jgi:hypothetical protein
MHTVNMPQTNAGNSIEELLRMDNNEIRDSITIEDQTGQLKNYNIEALFGMEEQSYVLLAADDELVLMRVLTDEQDEQYLVGIDDPQEAAAILDAYQIAVEASPAEPMPEEMKGIKGNNERLPEYALPRPGYE